MPPSVVSFPLTRTAEPPTTWFARDGSYPNEYWQPIEEPRTESECRERVFNGLLDCAQRRCGVL